MSMKVGFDLTWMSVRNSSGGVFQYAERLVSALVKHSDINIFAMGSEHVGDIFEHLSGHGNFRAAVVNSQTEFLEVIEKENISVVHTPVQNHKHLTMRIPMLTSLHDLQHFHFPEFFTEEEIRFRSTYYKISAEFSERVIISFEHVKDDIVRFYGIPPDKIDVCAFGMQPPKEQDASRLPAVKDKYGISGEYLFYSANTWKHKNHVNLIRALKILRSEYKHKIRLLCTGQKLPEFFLAIAKEIKKQGLDGYVNFTGYIPEDEMLLLMSNASLVVIPTLYEAGSFPLLEAMNYGVPVICSNATSLPDTIGNARFVFDPHNVKDIADKANLMLRDEKLREENMANSRMRMGEMGWEKKVGAFVESYEKAVAGFEEKRRDRAFTGLVDNYEFLINDYYQQTFGWITDSLSWKITAPLRAMKNLLMRMVART